jgi:capsular polysaccharide export protein
MTKHLEFVLTTSKTLSQVPFINVFIGFPVYLKKNYFGYKLRPLFILGWGIRSSTYYARYISQQLGINFCSAEDGFLRSYFPGKNTPSLSVVIDHQGIYYDSKGFSQLENFLEHSVDFSPVMKLMSDQAISHITFNRLSKYNYAPDFDFENIYKSFSKDQLINIFGNGAKKILVVDQTFGDMSVQYGGATSNTFTEMLSLAFIENPRATIFVKTHPEVSSGNKSGYLTSVKDSDRVVVLRDAVNPIDLIKKMDKVYVVTSGMGFEALLVGKPVVCFGVPWYAGWGLTDDRVVDSPAWTRRTRKRTVNELFAAAYIHYTRYLNPVTHQRGQITDVIDWLIRQKKMANQVHGPQRKNRVIGFGFRQWKAANLKPMLGLHQKFVHFAKDLKCLDQFKLQVDESIIYWGARPPADLVDYVSDRKAKLIHLEDGFIRSVGLGSDLIRPLSLVMDQRGLYFDATRPSDLEVMLNSYEFSEDDISRAQWVKQYIIDHEITKYNLEPREPINWRSIAKDRLIILVPGQVEDDASIRLGCTSINTNLDLIKEVRHTHPNAFIVYKPHPDVLSGNRKGKVSLKEIAPWVDHIEQNISVVSCINACDEVHTMTSLTGFDALIRGKKVVTYGQPFYAGWGLTLDKAHDGMAFRRRTKKLTLEQLIAGALLHYPIYWDWDLKGYTTCEAVLHRIVEQRTQLEQSGKLDQLRIGWFRRQLRKLKVVVKSYC